MATGADAGSPPSVGGARDRERLFPPHQNYPPEADPVDEASEESFPASDAPSTWARGD